ncbi:MAG: folA [Gammaproteobacteria bacterium]|jgi:dihydrofolate reductase|nr:folA [Gammaproteobacteria bacterium]
MIKISLIAAMDKNHVIGNQNKLPWHLPADLKHFKELTLNKPIIMGRKTFESIGRPLPERKNIIITRDSLFRAEGCHIYHSIPEALAKVAAESEVMIIGGAAIFEQCLPLAQTLYLTIIEHDFVGDTYFPVLNPAEWREIAHQNGEPDEKNPYNYSFITLKRVG